MKNINVVYILSGAVVGYTIASIWEYPSPLLMWNVANGAILGLWLERAVSRKKHEALIWCIFVVLIAFLVDWIAGSVLNMANKLSFAFLGLFIGWDFGRYKKQVLLGGFAGGMIGFISGINNNDWIGRVYLVNALLRFIQFFFFGMAVGSLYMYIFGRKFIENDSQT